MEWKQGEVVKTELSAIEKIRYRSVQLFTLLAGAALLPLAAAVSVGVSLGSRIVSVFRAGPQKPVPPSQPPSLASALPADFGFADSLFQSSGIGTHAAATKLKGKSNWDKWLTPAHIEGSANYREFFVDILRDPRPFISILRKMNVTAHRFSLEWAVIEPEPGKIDAEAVALYRNFIRELKEAGIEPYVTLHHFVLPEWFADFDSLEKIEPFVAHSLRMMETFPEVKNWMTFNEPGVYAFSTRVRGAYPPGGKGDLHGAGQTLRNLLIAHCKIYQAAKEKFGDQVQVGITHQWLKFEPLEGNFLERAICYFLSKITHDCVYDFFKTGHFTFEATARANVHFDVSQEEFQKNRGFLDFIGVQFYGFPRLKAGFNGGEEYPGYKTMNYLLWKSGLTFGSTCPKGGKTMSFGPSFYPESLSACLEEAAALKKPIAITETGCDARIQKWGDKEWRIDDEAQKEYFVKIAPILHRFKDQMKAFFTWTLYRGQLEWERGDFPSLGVVKLQKDRTRTITGCELTPAAKLLRDAFEERKYAQPNEGVA